MFNQESRREIIFALTQKMDISEEDKNQLNLKITHMVEREEIVSKVNALKNIFTQMVQSGIEISQNSVCPITQRSVENPVVASDGHTYEEWAINGWRQQRRRDHLPLTSPLTREPLTFLAENIALRRLIQELKEKAEKEEKDLPNIIASLDNLLVDCISIGIAIKDYFENERCSRQVANESQSNPSEEKALANNLLESRNRDLKDENRTLESQNRTLKSQNYILESQNHTLESRHHDLESRNRDFENENPTLVNRNRDLENENRTLVAEREELKVAFDGERNQNRILESWNRDLESRNRIYQDRILRPQRKEDGFCSSLLSDLSPWALNLSIMALAVACGIGIILPIVGAAVIVGMLAGVVVRKFMNKNNREPAIEERNPINSPGENVRPQSPGRPREVVPENRPTRVLPSPSSFSHSPRQEGGRDLSRSSFFGNNSNSDRDQERVRTPLNSAPFPINN